MSENRKADRRVGDNVLRVFRLFLLMSKWRITALVLSGIIGATIPAMQVSLTASAVQAVVDAVAGGPLTSSQSVEILSLSGALAGLLLGGYLLSIFDQFLSTVLRLDITRQISEMVMTKSSRMDLQQFEASDTYDILQRASSETGPRIFDMFLQLVEILRNFITLVTVSAVLFTWNPLIAVLILLAPIPSILANFKYGKMNYDLEYGRAAQRRRQFYYRYLTTNDGPVKEIRLFGLAPHLVGKYNDILRLFFAQDIRLARFQLFVVGGLGILSVAISSGALVYAFFATLATAQVGRLAGYLQAIGTVQTSATGLLLGFAQFYQSALYLGNLFDFFDLPDGVIASGHRPFPKKLKTGIEFRDVHFTYPGTDVIVLAGVSFSLPVNRCVALVGENGSGKTTIVKLLSRLYAPSSGQILIDDIPLEEFDLEDLRRNIGVIFQDFIRYEMPVRENIGFGRIDQMQDNQRLQDAAVESGAASFILGLPEGLDTMLGRHFEKGRQLSIGQWQKVALARAFMRRAPIVVLDEPTASIDAKAEASIFENFREVASKTTSLLIAHRFSTVRIADVILVLEDGAIVERGSHSHLMSERGLYYRLFTLQARGYGADEQAQAIK